ncbi:NADH:ubiquinone oxidoreductase, ESSS subunit [Phaffia rhodozyma]|uniref:NADH dehydrogenase [ubiquinone] 1 beta subcomplex subunit 11, mitochondrial n=1 Tax=Phaffia rhodozyma TaxID=264483 RepID=A0A0F7SSA9_PHARH|nr:NADH:ubiquinone oxidoreductase, ESSS subunit [Phaffia rhodozyma]
MLRPNTLVKMYRPVLFVPVSPQLLASQKRFAHGFNEPTGYLFGEKPLPKGQKRQKELWEYIFFWPMIGGAAAFCTLNYYFGGQRREWAMKEAARRLKERGEYPTYTPTVPAGVNFNPPHPDKQ